LPGIQADKIEGVRYRFMLGLDMDELAVPGPKVQPADPRRNYTTWKDMFGQFHRDKKKAEDSSIVPLGELLRTNRE
jgi:hypothetical protein